MQIPKKELSKQFISQFLPENPIIIEAGAHIGRDTVKMAKLWPSGKIYAFEPVPELFAKLKENTKEYSNIFCFQLALSNKVGQAVLHVSSGATTAASSLLQPKEYLTNRPNVNFRDITVHTITLGAWAEENKVNHIDFMWLDMQGHELEVLRASKNYLPNVSAILIEVSLTERFEGNPLYQDVIDWLLANNFKPIAQDEPKHNKVNILAVK